MFCLGIETSCDETAVAVVKRGKENAVLSEVIKSQIPLHSRFGGVVPEIASRTHLEAVDILTRDALIQAGTDIDTINLISLTLGPGLLGSLLVGLSFAKGLSWVRKIPIVPVDHILAHVEAAFISHPHIDYPLVALVVSGGHTTLFYQEAKFKSQVIAKTRDDAAGEVMDKIAKYFALGYPGGPVLDSVYLSGNPRRFSFSTPKMTDGSNDFSFSGYKTAVLRLAESQHIERGSRSFNDLLASFLHTIVEYLLEKTLAAVRTFKVRSLVVSGGVSRNSLLRTMFRQASDLAGINLFLPEPGHCTDNAAMVAWLGYERYQAYPKQDYFDLALNSYSRSPFRETVKHR